MENTPGKIAYLDGIRGVSALFVFFHHFALIFYISYYGFDPAACHIGNAWEVGYGRSVFSVLTNGNFFVCVFFILSGFVLSMKYFQTNNINILASGAIRRFLRLYFPMAFTLIVSYLLLTYHGYRNVEVSEITKSWWFPGQWKMPDAYKTLCSCLTTGTLLQGDASLDTSMWSLSYEFFGSMFVYSFLALTHNTRARFVLLLFMLGYWYATNQIYMFGFGLGISLNYISSLRLKWNRATKISIAALLVPIALVLGSYPSSTDTHDTLFEHLGHTLLEYTAYFHIVGAFFLVASFVISETLRRWASLGVFRFLGYISFSLYLIHPIVFGSVSSYSFLFVYKYLPYNSAVAVVLLITLAATVAISWFMTKCVDEPGMRLSKYVYNRWVQNKQATAEN